MKKLIKGIVAFRKKSLTKYRDKFSKLALKQSPDALFIACCDSRVVPNVFASSDPGDLFVFRNIGNLVPPYQCKDIAVHATIEFSILSLNVQDIIICGHSECGAMHALMEGVEKAEASCLSLDAWLDFAASSYKRFKRLKNKKNNLTSCNLLSRVNVLQQLDNLKTYPLVMERLASRQLKIHGWWFDLETADVYHYDEDVADFVLIDKKEAGKILKKNSIKKEKQ